VIMLGEAAAIIGADCASADDGDERILGEHGGEL